MRRSSPRAASTSAAAHLIVAVAARCAFPFAREASHIRATRIAIAGGLNGDLAEVGWSPARQAWFGRSAIIGSATPCRLALSTASG